MVAVQLPGLVRRPRVAAGCEEKGGGGLEQRVQPWASLKEFHARSKRERLGEPEPKLVLALDPRRLTQRHDSDDLLHRKLPVFGKVKALVRL